MFGTEIQGGANSRGGGNFVCVMVSVNGPLGITYTVHTGVVAAASIRRMVGMLDRGMQTEVVQISVPLCASVWRSPQHNVMVR